VREESGKIADRITFGEAISIVPQH
jgi:hypothetical protein